MSFVNFGSTTSLEKMLLQMQTYSKEVVAAASGPALANAALLLADGCAEKYVANLRVLYQANEDKIYFMCTLKTNIVNRYHLLFPSLP